MNRRDLLTSLGAAAGAAAFAGPLSPARAAEPARKLSLLVLGGTRFVGPHFIERARAHGHSVTIFNRGRTNVGRVKDVEVLTGDRNGQLGALKDRKWDAVLDTSGYVPRHVRLSAEMLAPHVAHYLFVSSISVYPSFAKPNDETSPVGKLQDETAEKVDGETYGPMKALCEQAAEKAMPGRVTVLRPGLIVGPDDNTDRFTYWPARVARGGEVLAPNSPADRIQIIDVRDLSDFALRCIEHKTLGVFNLVSHPQQFTMGMLLDACVKAAKNDAKATWVPAAFLAEQKVEGWSDMPVWMHAVGEEAAFADTSMDRAKAAGLSIRSLDDTVRDTLAWHRARPPEQQAKLKAGISPEREREVLAAWHAK
jgi:2'-hydroxyisoflavone reductase